MDGKVRFWKSKGDLATCGGTLEADWLLGHE